MKIIKNSGMLAASLGGNLADISWMDGCNNYKAFGYTNISSLEANLPEGISDQEN